MVSQKQAPSAVTNNPPEVAPGIPAVEVDPTNELLDGENLEEKKALLEDPVANVQVDPSGRRLESKESARIRELSDDPKVDPLLYIPPPAAANLELRKRSEKFVTGLERSYSDDPDAEDATAKALEAEREGLQRRADAGDEKAAKRVGQVDESLKSRAADARKASSERGKAPADRSSKPQQQS